MCVCNLPRVIPRLAPGCYCQVTKRKIKMVVNTEILLQAWRERWTPLQWLVEVKKLAGKDNEELQDLAGYL